MPTVRYATIEDVDSLTPRLRKADLMEIEALGQDPRSALEESFWESDDTFAVESDSGLVVAMFGLAYPGVVWMVGSDDLKAYRTTLMRDTPHYLEMFHTKYPVLWNLVDIRNTVHLGWLKRFGFQPVKFLTLGPQKQTFVQVVRTHPSCVPSPQPA